MRNFFKKALRFLAAAVLARVGEEISKREKAAGK